ncbi:MAG: FixH family protein [Erythrobacter sp.]
MHRQFTGRHMTAILVAGFGIVVAVNFTMATLATRGFGGVVVENSYVASQKYNSWLEQARAQDRLGYAAEVTRDAGGHILVSTENVPEYAIAAAEIRRPLGKADKREIAFERIGPALLRSVEAVPAGRWSVRLTLKSGSLDWASEAHIS